MGYAIELSLSNRSRVVVDKLWEDLSKNNVSSMMTDVGARPHISLAVFDELIPEKLQEELKIFAQNTTTFSVNLSFVGSFPTNDGVVFIAPVMTTEIINIHRLLHKILNEKGIESIEYYRPNNWVPHCTAAIDVAPEMIGKAIEICLQSKAFGPIELDEVSLIEFRPIRMVYSYKLNQI